MDDEVMNGTNRVVLDGVMTEKECDRILQLAAVNSDAQTVKQFTDNHSKTLI